MKLSENIKTLRKKKYIPQSELAERLTISRQAISKWEAGTSLPDVEMLIKLADIFEVTLDDLVLKDMDLCAENGSVETELNTQIPTVSEKDDRPTGEARWFIREDIDNTTEYITFKKAYAAENIANQEGNNEKIVEAVHLYQEAFDGGILAAAVNIIRIVMITQMNCKAKSPDKPIPFQDKIEYFTTALKEKDHPAGEYYEALGLIMGTIENENTEDDNWDNGLIYMKELADEGNKYAITFYETLEEDDDEVDPIKSV